MSPVRREGYKFCQDIVVPSYSTGADSRMKPAGFMNFAQEIAYWAANELGFGYDKLHETKEAWVLARMHMRFFEMPAWRDLVHLYTWHKGMNSLFFLRDFRLFDDSEKMLATCTSSWVVINEETRHFVRPESIQGLLTVDGVVDSAIDEPAPKLLPPRDATLEEAGSHVVGYSDIDLIGHTNNVRYVVWAMDVLPPELSFARPVKELFINFIKETKLGEAVSLFRFRTEEDGVEAWYVEGRVDGRSCFSVKFVF